MPCHKHVDYESEDWRLSARVAPQCAGRAQHFENRCKKPRMPDLMRVKGRDESVFSNPQEFVDHHTLGKEIPQIAIIGSRVMVVGTKAPETST